MMQVKASRNTSNDGRDGVEDPGLKVRPGIQDITNGEEGKSVDRG